jgi:hypothetical protein
MSATAADPAALRIMAEAFSAIMITTALVLPDGRVGMIEAGRAAAQGFQSGSS